jgi:hypothetical protein
MNGPVNMFVAEALDETMAGTLFADVSEPLYVNTLAPDSDKAVAVEDGVIEPVIDIVAADVHVNPIAPAPPTIDPDTLILVAVVDTATVVDPPVITPFTVKVVPVNNTEPSVDWLPPFTLPFIVSVPAD